MTEQQGLRWDDPELREPRDTDWAAGCRLLQTWWREEVLGLDHYGPAKKAKPGRLVGSMLPSDAGKGSNFLDPVVHQEVDARLDQKGSRRVSKDRLRRDLLSSDALAFNLFAYLEHHPKALLAWIKSLGIDAIQILDVRLDWAPPRKRHFDGDTSFDAAVFYRTGAGALGLVGVECTYADDLAADDVEPKDLYLQGTRTNGHWRAGAAEALQQPHLTQLWLNTLLVQSCVEQGEDEVTEAVMVMLAMGADDRALEATARVRSELVQPDRWLTWCSYEDVLDAAEGTGLVTDWAAAFRRRYLDFTPVTRQLAESDRRGSGIDHRTAIDERARRSFLKALTEAEWMAERVLGKGTPVDQIANNPLQNVTALGLLTLARRLEEFTEAGRLIRVVAHPSWSKVSTPPPAPEAPAD
jgi:hypothetical protein